MTKDEALKLALEALECWQRNEDCNEPMSKILEAIKEALAQPEQEPVAWKLMPRDATDAMLKAMDECSTDGYDERLYAGHAASVYMAAWDVYPDINQKQEPVPHAVIAGALFDFMGWLTSRKERLVLSSADEASPAVDAIRDFAKMRGLSLDDAKVLDWNTTPPQRPWVYLTDDEIKEIVGPYGDTPIKGYTRKLFDQIEAALRSKNT